MKIEFGWKVNFRNVVPVEYWGKQPGPLKLCLLAEDTIKVLNSASVAANSLTGRGC